MAKEYNGWTAEKLDAFEDDIKACFLRAEIKHPIHLSKGNSQNLVDIFAEYDIGNKEDWVYSNHRSHYHALLKGIPPAWIKEQIYHGNSMHLMNSEYKFFAGSIVCGSVPIAVGTAMGIKRQGGTNHVWVFVGDMAASTGIFHENMKYAERQNLPITFVIEDNDLSTNTPTRETWGNGECLNLITYSYERGCPHINVDSFVEFK